MGAVRASLEQAIGPELRVVRELTGGGMSRLFLARDVALDRDVVVKLLPPDLVSEVSSARFRREVELTVRLQHPHILPVLRAGSTGDDGELLFYISPFIAGESLRDRIARDGALSLEDVERIWRQVAEALRFAHGEGIVHRDVKPGNVLLSQGHAVLADFGIARAFLSEEDALTRTESMVGTPAYFAPERPTDHTADLYGLAIVAHEMLTGRRPEGVVTEARILTARRAAGRQAGGRRERALAAIVERALALHPADRFPSADALLQALAHPERHLARARLRRARPVGVALFVLAAVAYPVLAPLFARTPLVEDRYLVVPFAASGDTAQGMALAAGLSSALGEWRGVQVAEVTRASAALRRANDLEAAVKAARAASAARLVTGEILRLADRVELRATLLDAASGRPLRTVTLPMTAGDTSRTAMLRRIANSLLRAAGAAGAAGAETPHEPRPSLAAWRAFDRGRAALGRWQLGAAATAFREAVRLDSLHAPAQLRLALALTWEDSATTQQERQGAARRAVELSAQLEPGDAQVARGLLALAENRPRDACDSFRGDDFTSLVGLGDCEARDRLVVGDTRGRWRFRGDYARAARWYERALTTVVGPQPEFVHARLARVLFVESNRLRAGQDSMTGRRFLAYAALRDGEPTFAPEPVDARMPTIPPTLSAALERNLRQMRILRAAWVRSDSLNWRARRALSEALEATGNLSDAGEGDVTAIGEIRAARALLRDSTQLPAVIVIEVRQLVRNGEYARARSLADSALDAWRFPEPKLGDALSALAALTGRESRLLAELRAGGATVRQRPTDASGQPVSVSDVVLRVRAELFGIALLGGCDRPRLERLVADVQRLGRSNVVIPSEQRRVEDALLVVPLMSAAPCLGTDRLGNVTESRDALVRAMRAHARQDAIARDALLGEARLRLRAHPRDISMEYAYGEAWLMAAAGDTAVALQHIATALDALPSANRSLLDRPAQAAGMVRSMALAALLAHQRHDRPLSTRWARAVVALWSGADQTLQPLVAEMRAIAH